MASNFPTSLDSFTNPSATDAMDSVTVPHATQHADLNDAVEALEAKVGADGSAVTSSLDYKVANQGTYVSYTPTFTNLTVGNATLNFTYTQIGKFVHVVGVMYFGSTTSISSTPYISLPVTRYTNDLEVLGTGYLGDTGTGTYLMFPLAVDTTRVIMFGANHTVGSTIIEGATTSTVPFTWTTNDRINLNLSYRAA